MLKQEIRMDPALKLAFETLINDRFVSVFQYLEHPYPWCALQQGVPGPLLRCDLTDPRQGLDLMASTYGDIDRIPTHALVDLLLASMYEFETVPDGNHVLLEIMNESERELYLAHLKQGLNSLGCDGGFLNLNPEIQSDSLLAQHLDMPYSCDIPQDLATSQKRYCVRTPHVTEQPFSNELYDILAAHSVWDVYGDSRKDPLVALDIAEFWCYGEQSIRDLPWDEGWCIKPVFSTRSGGVVIAPPDAPQAARRLLLKKLEATERKYGRDGLIKMPYIPPAIEEIDNQPYKSIWRVFFVYDGTRYHVTPLVITTANPLAEGVDEPVHGSKQSARFAVIRTS